MAQLSSQRKLAPGACVPGEASGASWGLVEMELPNTADMYIYIYILVSKNIGWLRPSTDNLGKPRLGQWVHSLPSACLGSSMLTPTSLQLVGMVNPGPWRHPGCAKAGCCFRWQKR